MRYNTRKFYLAAIILSMFSAPPQTIVLASNNRGKISELQALLTSYTIMPQSAFDVGDVAETGSTFVENAIIKARHAASLTHMPALADDSGLVVDALQGAPGVFSARYAGEGATDAANNAKLLQALADVPEQQRSARFICVLAFLRHTDDPMPILAQAVWEGVILSAPRGTQGFGYDPLFWLPAQQCSSAELSLAEKNTLSHRGQALRLLAASLGNTYV